MGKTQQNFAVMFADVAGSTQLYEKVGDSIANQMIGDAIKLASDIIINHHGTIVKTIGDEVMCRFVDANQALRCACEINETMEKQPVRNGVGLFFSIGVHWGTAILQDDGDIFGDVVNLAAKIAKKAKSRQIITTDTTHRCLTSKALKSKCHQLEPIHVKGRSEAVPIFEVMWEPDELQCMPTIVGHSLDLISNKPLHIYYQHRKQILQPGSPAYTFGRGAQCDQLVASTLASRVHARIESRQGIFFLIDESTNGTYIKIDNKSPVFLRQQEIALQDNGVISFGEELSDSSEFVLRFNF